jgi:hypothetical protein
LIAGLPWPRARPSFAIYKWPSRQAMLTAQAVMSVTINIAFIAGSRIAK